MASRFPRNGIVVSTIFDPTAAREKREQRIADAMHKLLEQFPPH
jgi:hypothetical protein